MQIYKAVRLVFNPPLVWMEGMFAGIKTIRNPNLTNIKKPSDVKCKTAVGSAAADLIAMKSFSLSVGDCCFDRRCL
jgi:hypothetical protein